MNSRLPQSPEPPPATISSSPRHGGVDCLSATYPDVRPRTTGHRLPHQPEVPPGLVRPHWRTALASSPCMAPHARPHRFGFAAPARRRARRTRPGACLALLGLPEDLGDVLDLGEQGVGGGRVGAALGAAGAGQLGGVVEELVQLRVLLEVRWLEVVGPQHPEVMLDEVGALFLDVDRPGAELGVGVLLVLLADGLDRFGFDPGLGRVVDAARQVAVRERGGLWREEIHGVLLSPEWLLTDYWIRHLTVQLAANAGRAGIVHWPLWRIAVAERSMEPALLPGDWLLVWRGLGPRRPAIKPGQLVIARHPGLPGMLLVKRVAWRE